MVRTFLKVYMELGSSFCFCKNKSKTSSSLREGSHARRRSTFFKFGRRPHLLKIRSCGLSCAETEPESSLRAPGRCVEHSATWGNKDKLAFIQSQKDLYQISFYRAGAYRDGWGVRVRRHFGTRGRSSVRYGTRFGDLKENWFLLFSN